MIALGVLLAVGAVLLGRKLASRWGNWYATVAGCAAFTVAVGLALAFLPAGDPIPHDFPADVLWRFRLASLGVQALLWTALGLILGHLAQRVLEPAAVTAAATTGDTAPGASVAAH